MFSRPRVVFWIAAVAVVILDRATKSAVAGGMRLGESIDLIKGGIEITYIRNSGGAFGLFPSSPIFFTMITVTVLVSALLIYFLRSPRHLLENIALGLVLGGTIGNLYDRLTVGMVIDWIDFQIWPVFNIADSALFIGLSIISFRILFPAGADYESTG